MNQEVIQSFLNLQGIAGIALIDGRSRPYFCGIDQALNFQQKEALAQGILQVIETIPEGFDSFEFQFTGHDVYIYKLKHGIVLLVLTNHSLVYAEYLKIIKDLKATLQEDIANAIATFRLIAGNITLSGIDYSKMGQSDLNAAATSLPPVVRSSQATTDRPVAPSPSQQPAVSSPSATSSPVASETPIPAAPSLKDVVAAFNQLSQFTADYLGPHVISNYWKSTRPENDWLAQFQVDRTARFSLDPAIASNAQQPVIPSECELIQTWVAAFIKRCTVVIRDFPALVEQKALTDAQKAILLKRP